LQDQDALLDRLAVIVEHSVQQVEDEVSSAAAAAAAQEAARYEQASGKPRCVCACGFTYHSAISASSAVGPPKSP